MKKLFVAMPYRRRKAPLDYDKPDVTVEIDFDAVWEEILQPAVPERFETKRADELRKSGLIDRLYNEWLFDADIVLADLTFGNPNVYYELGIRQALSKKGTVLVACNGTKLPFDVRNQYVINYDYFAAPTLRTFQSQLREAIENASSQEVDSPVHVYLPGLFVGRAADGTSPEKTIRQLTQRVEELEIDCKRLTNTPVRQAGSVLKCPDDCKNRVVSAQATYASTGSAVGGRVCEQRYAAEQVLPESRFELRHTGSPPEKAALEEKA